MIQLAISAWVRLVLRHPALTLIALLVLGALAANYSAKRFSVDGEMRNLVAESAEWRTEYDHLREHFPELRDSALLVIEGESVDSVHRATRDLYDVLRTNERFAEIFAPAVDPVLEQHALLFLKLDALEDAVDRLVAAQPLLAAVANGEGAAGILDAIERGLIHDAQSEALEPLLSTMAQSAGASLGGEAVPPAWRDPLLNDERQRTALIWVGRVDKVPKSEFQRALRATIAETPLPAGVSVGLTGAIPLAQEELAAAEEGIALASVIALILLTAIFLLGVRSLRLFIGIVVMLPFGLAMTAAWGLLAIGQFNPISMVFAVVFFGLGVDFAIHFGLRYQEKLPEYADHRAALAGAADSIGSTLLLCALTTAIAFLAFFPTSYQGLSDLGVIAAGGMLIAVVLSLTLLPACFALMGPPRHSAHRLQRQIAPIAAAALCQSRWILGTVALLAVLSAVLLPQMRFEYSVMALKNPEAESVQMLRKLQAARIASDYNISVLAANEDEVKRLETELEALPEVEHVRSPYDYVPSDQDDKRFLLEDIDILLAPYLTPPDPKAAPQRLGMAIDALESRLLSMPESTAVHDATRRLLAALQALRDDGEPTLAAWEQTLLESLTVEMRWLRTALRAPELGFDDLPEALRMRLISPQGMIHLSVLPAEDVSDIAALSRYVETVQQVAPQATGRPVIEKALGEVVTRAFAQAFLLAVAAITVVLLLSLRSLRETLLVLAPLGLAALLTAGIQVLASVPLNMANVLVLPLIFGLGVDSSIHVVRSFHRGGVKLDDFVQSSTPRAVLLSGLTTVGSFAALALAPHQGIASIGWLLSVAVSCMLLVVIGLLPLVLAKRPSDDAH